MRKNRIAGLLILLTVLLCSCGPEATYIQLDFRSDDAGTIICDDFEDGDLVEYVFYGYVEKTDLTYQIGTLDGDGKDRIYSYGEYHIDQFIAEMYVSGEMDTPLLYRAVGCDIIPDGVRAPDDDEDEEKYDITYLIEDPLSFKEISTGYTADGYVYKNYFVVDDPAMKIKYIVLSDRETMTLEEVLMTLYADFPDGSTMVVGYYSE